MTTLNQSQETNTGTEHPPHSENRHNFRFKYQKCCLNIKKPTTVVEKDAQNELLFGRERAADKSEPSYSWTTTTHAFNLNTHNR